MKNLHLDRYTATDIDLHVSKILRDLGNPPPPLDLDKVRELLKLAREYYSNTDDGVFKRWIHSLKLAGKQIAERPAFLKDLVQSFRLDALCLFDEKRILISSELPEPKQRWAEGHEIGHTIIPWHGPISLGDDKYTLTANCHDAMEAEANYGARRLLFLRDQFRTHALSSPPTLKHIRDLKGIFQNTMTTTFYALVEELDIPAFGLITDHPRRPSTAFNPQIPARHFITSLPFDRQFGSLTQRDLYRRVQGYCGWGKWDLGRSDEILVNTRGESYIFHLETVFNTYDALTLGVLVGPHKLLVGIASHCP